ncbi:MAG: hypothetical protein M3P00_07750 [Gemmatimonadota bacterium]|nr:hypothetical protein [Gemmatimonadota bacterium]
MTHRIAKLIALAILASCAREATIRDVPASQPAAKAIPPGNASSTVSQAPDTFSVPDSVIGDADDESVPPIEDSTEFSCTPRSLGPRDTLTLHLATPHGGELMVLTPSDVFFSFVYPQLEDPTQKYSIVPSEDFKTMSTLKVPADIRLPPKVYGKDTVPEAVFSRPGQYVLQMGDKMESDHTGPPYICKVMVTP